jgi:stage V sporulation protein D (sporulation-specific penicillin-binding protein)
VAKQKKKKKKPTMKFSRKMRSKLLVVFGMIVAGLIALIARLMYIEHTSGEKYKKKVLSLQSYDSSTIPYQRGDILDCNGTVLATSTAVYNVILDCTVMTDQDAYIKPTIDALLECFPDLDRATLESYATEKKDSAYIVLEKKLPYSEIQKFVEMQEEVDEKGNQVNPYIKGVWFEKEYQRTYPYGSLAASLIGFTSSGDVGTTGLENYYDDVLNGVNGREYGYLNSDNDFEKTVIAAQDGYNLVCSIDENIEAIVTEKINEFNDLYTNHSREGAGAEHIAVLIMNPNNGEILAMAETPGFDLNNPRSLNDYYTEEELAEMSGEDMYLELNSLWQNYCVTETYEPGSVQKPFTIACGLETGMLTPDMTFYCDGYELIADYTIHCVNRNGHGMETLEGSLMDSCNDALMQMSYLIGADNFTEFQSIFGFGMKTGIDLPGEASTATLVYTADNITKVDLATNSFGQNYNCTMVQMASAFSSLINGGTYYQPHIVTKITDSDGNIIESIEPTVLKQTVSEGTSSLIKDYLYSVVSSGTGKTAKVDGYSMGGKTGTAQMYDEETHKRKEGSYLVSFLGFAPYDDPQLVIYCIVDQPNVDEQDHSTYAQNITREILKEVLPYMNIYPDEELTGQNENLTISGSEVLQAQGTTTRSDDTAGDTPEDTGTATGSDDTAEEPVE